MTHCWIIAMYLAPLVVLGALWIVGEVGFYLFCQVFGVVDNYLQNRHWQNRVTAADVENLRRTFDREYKEAV